MLALLFLDKTQFSHFYIEFETALVDRFDWVEILFISPKPFRFIFISAHYMISTKTIPTA